RSPDLRDLRLPRHYQLSLAPHLLRVCKGLQAFRLHSLAVHKPCGWRRHNSLGHHGVVTGRDRAEGERTVWIEARVAALRHLDRRVVTLKYQLHGDAFVERRRDDTLN